MKNLSQHSWNKCNRNLLATPNSRECVFIPIRSFIMMAFHNWQRESLFSLEMHSYSPWSKRTIFAFPSFPFSTNTERRWKNTCSNRMNTFKMSKRKLSTLHHVTDHCQDAGLHGQSQCEISAQQMLPPSFGQPKTNGKRRISWQFEITERNNKYMHRMQLNLQKHSAIVLFCYYRQKSSEYSRFPLVRSWLHWRKCSNYLAGRIKQMPEKTSKHCWFTWQYCL